MKREWQMQNTIDFDKMKYSSTHGGVGWNFIPYFKPGKLQAIGAKGCAYKIRSVGGTAIVGEGKLNYLESKYKEPKKIKIYDFGKYSDGVTTVTEDDNDSNPKKTKFNPKKLNFMDERNEINPIQTNTSDSDYLFDNEDAIVVNFKKKKNQ